MTTAEEAVAAGSEAKAEEPKEKKFVANWPALESNPDALTDFIRQLGVSKGTEIVDVFGFEPDLLMMIPQPIYSIIFLFPPKRGERAPRVYDDDAKEKLAALEKTGNGFFMWQTKPLDNACGCIACIHAVANNLENVPLEDDSALMKYLLEAQSGSAFAEPEAKGKLLETFAPIKEKHMRTANSAQNSTRMETGKVNFHFVCFNMSRDGTEVIEFDGMNSTPVRRPLDKSLDATGGAMGDSMAFALNVGDIIKKEYMDKMPGELNFVTLALSKSG